MSGGPAAQIRSLISASFVLLLLLLLGMSSPS